MLLLFRLPSSHGVRLIAGPVPNDYWTLGGNQVGKAAIDGWQNVVRPALALGASLWPFDGSLENLSSLNGCGKQEKTRASSTRSLSA
jgi:hypothetical protein